jgi:hypothetical protein
VPATWAVAVVAARPCWTRHAPPLARLTPLSPAGPRYLRCDSGEALASLDSVAAGAAPARCGSLSWWADGAALVAACGDRHVRVLDPRAGGAAPLAFEAHAGARPMRAAVLPGAAPAALVLTVGFDSGTSRSAALWDVRAAGKPVQRLTLSHAMATPYPLVDPDTNLVFLPTKVWMDGRMDGLID